MKIACSRARLGTEPRRFAAWQGRALRRLVTALLRSLPHTRWTWLVLLVSVSALADPHITYSKLFKGSDPEFITISVEKDGSAVYQEAQDDPNSLRFRLTPEEAGEMFALAAKLGAFTRPVESGLKVANMGRKTFRFEDGPVVHEVSFNYSIDADARQLLNVFERVANTEQLYLNLDRAVHFDKLGVDHAIIQIRMLWDAGRLVAPDQFLPLLARIAKNESFMHVDRERAASLSDEFRSGKPTVEKSSR
jgi:hypothetical protein